MMNGQVAPMMQPQIQMVQQPTAQPQVVVMQAPQPQIVVPTVQTGRTPHPGERTDPKSQKGCTKLNNPGMIEIKYNADIKDLSGCDKCLLGCGTCCCLSFDKNRSYLYVRENSIESNAAMQVCWNPATCRCCHSSDFVNVMYFDKDPFEKGEGCIFCPGCCPYDPKLEVTDDGCLICCVKCCSRKRVVFMPYETYCCCCKNRVNGCDNCCGCCGPITGNPKVFSSWWPQPKDPEAFVKVCQPTQVEAMQRA